MSQTKSYLTLPTAPAIPGLAFRLFQGKADFPAIQAVRKQVRAIDGDIWLPGPDTASNPVCNPLQDCLIAEVDGQVIGYTWLIWWSEPRVEVFLHLGWLVFSLIQTGPSTLPLNLSERQGYVKQNLSPLFCSRYQKNTSFTPQFDHATPYILRDLFAFLKYFLL